MITNTIINSVNAGRGGHFYSIRGAAGIVATSEKLAELFNISNPDQIAYTQNATYALNMAIGGILKNGGHAVVTQMEHNSVLRPVDQFGNYSIVLANEEGYVNAQDVEKAITPETKLIVCTHISNVCGTIQPIEEIGKIAKKHKILFLVDAAQSAGCINIDVEKLNIDMLAFSGHKGLLSPLGVGGLYVREDIDLTPIILGGTGSFSESLKQPLSMPDLLQSGTLNTPAIMALGDAVDYIIKKDPEQIGKREAELANLFIQDVLNMDDIIVYGKKNGKGRNGTVAFNIKDKDSVRIAEILNDEYKICVRGGWHCAFYAHKAIGSAKSGAVRVSFGAFDNKRSQKKLTDSIYKILKNNV